MARDPIKVVGLKEFRKGLKGMDRGLPKTIRLTFNSVADVLVDETRPKIPRLTGAAAGTLKAQSTQTAARVSMGGNKAPYLPWLDFGGKTGPKKSVVRPFIRTGRYFFPTLDENRDTIQDLMLSGLTKLAESNGIEVD